MNPATTFLGIFMAGMGGLLVGEGNSFGAALIFIGIMMAA